MALSLASPGGTWAVTPDRPAVKDQSQHILPLERFKPRVSPVLILSSHVPGTGTASATQSTPGQLHKARGLQLLDWGNSNQQSSSNDSEHLPTQPEQS